MRRKDNTTTISDVIKEMVRRQLRSGWTAERVAYEMQKLGNKGWSSGYLHHVLGAEARPLTADEAAGLIAVFGGHARMVMKEIERLTAMITSQAGIKDE